MVGPQPPPVHGLAAVNQAVLAAFRERDVSPVVINLAGVDLRRTLMARLARLPRVCSGMLKFALTRGVSGGTCYVSVSGGFGKLIEAGFVALARVKCMSIVLHHHSYAYLDRPSLAASLLCRVAGKRAQHIVQSPRMAQELGSRYGVSQVYPVSNAAFVPLHFLAIASKDGIRAIGFVSNISAEKGAFDFLDVCERLHRECPGMQALMAGPFQDASTEQAVRARLERLPNVRYWGAVYGERKREFLDSIDVLLFPTRYRHETEGIVNIEAMSRAVPVIAYGRGCIPELLKDGSGQVIDPAASFPELAIAQVRSWQADPASYRRASSAALRNAAALMAVSRDTWQVLMLSMVGSEQSAGRR